MFLLRIC
ncbi:UNVERIFIED_CONTAM: hypothetical protein GTU68_033919 [Idotea baltica]|nr:hypothetical protein [Idotea baltica]